KVVDVSGELVPNADIVLTYGPTNTTQSVSSNADGTFAMFNLQLGGPYRIKADSGNSSGSLENLYLVLGKDAQITITVASAAAMDELVVVGKSLSSANLLATGPSVFYGLDSLQEAAAAERDIKDLLSTHPRLSLDEGGARGIQCNGSSPRMNSLTVDGIALNDGFGLNDNGYPANRMPFSYDAIKQVSAEFAPFDVQYGGFSACVVNAITKSGSNEFKGNFFYEYTNEDLLSDEVDGNKIQNTPFDEDKYGFTLGGPILKDKLYFFTAYEYYNDQDTVDYGPVGSGAPVEMAWLTQDTLDLVTTTLIEKYGFDPGGIPSAIDSFSEKLLVKLDYYYSDITRATFTYNYSEGFSNNYSDTYYTQLELAKHGYENGNTLHAYMFNLYSKIGDINTEVRVGYRDLDNRQEGIGGPFGEFDIENITGGGDIMVGGTDDSRQANDLDYDNLTMAFVGDFVYGNQLITFGVEREEQSTFNMFVQHSLGGEWDFYTFDNFLNGIVDRVYYGNNPSLNPADAGATWDYDITTLFAQSEWTPSDILTVSYGIRYEKYGVDGAPNENPAFVSAYGRPNTHTHDGESVVMPRLSFTYNLNDSTEIYGGIGTFSGGNPNVWYSNIWSNDGVSNIQLSLKITLCTYF
ncbi:MAG: TonB-dependent receptor, partial [Proteobacteria bacterium]|nr:TonB-dependent receptor [Pseudomonadota bacterium]